MATRAELMDALRRADAAGDSEAARAIARRIHATPPEGGAPKADFSGVTATVSSKKNDPDYDKMTPGEILADAPRRFKESGRGIWHSVKGTGRAAQQIAATLMGDKERMAELQAEEAAAREALASETGTFQEGNIMGHILQSAIPAGAGARVTGGLAKVALAEGALGAAQGALAPTTEGESRAKNVAIGGTIGAALPASGAIVRKIGDVAEYVPYLGARVTGSRVRRAGEEAARASALRQHASDVRRVEAANERIDRQVFNNARQAVKEQFAGKQKDLMRRIGREFTANTEGARIAVPNKRVEALRSIQRRYGEDLPPEFGKLVEDMALASKHGSAKGEMLQQAKAALGDRARGNARRGLPSTGLHEAERVVTDTILEGLPKQRADALRIAYGRYAKVANAKPVLPKPPVRAKQPIPALPSTEKPGAIPWLRHPATRAAIRSLLLRPETETEE